MARTLILSLLTCGLLAPVAATAQDSNGFYVGTELGYDRLEERAEGIGLEVDGFALRGYAGYDWQLPNSLFFGVEAGGMWSDASGRPDVTIPEIDIRLKSEWALDAMGRFGIVSGDGSKFFATAGVVTRRLSVRVDDLITPGDSVSDSTWDEAFQWGIGAEIPFNEQISFRARFNTYDDELFDQYQLFGGVTYKF